MLSRVAENLYWMSRNLERAENVVRLLDIGLYLELDAATSSIEDGHGTGRLALQILASPAAAHDPTEPDADRMDLLVATHIRPFQSPVNPQPDRAGPRECEGHAGEPGCRRLERGQSAVPLPAQPVCQATI